MFCLFIVLFCSFYNNYSAFEVNVNVDVDAQSVVHAITVICSHLIDDALQEKKANICVGWSVERVVRME